MRADHPQHKLVLGHGRNVAMHPGRYAAVHIGVATLEYQADSHFIATLLALDRHGLIICLDQIQIARKVCQFATRHRTRLAIIGAEHEPRLVVEIAQAERPGIRAGIHAHRHGRKTLDGAGALRCRLVPQVGSGFGKPLQEVDQAALVDLQPSLAPRSGSKRSSGCIKCVLT